MRGRVAALLMLLPGLTPAARAADEIQVFDGEVTRPGEWSLLQHFNYGTRARRLEAGDLLPTNGTLRGMAEVARGLAPGWEVGVHIPAAARNDRFYLSGGKLRSLLAVPDAGERPFFYGLNVEVSWQSRFFSRSRWNLEFRPILGLRSGPWEFIVNPIVDVGLGGRQGNSFLPATRVAYRLGPEWQVAAETYSDLGPFGGFASLRRQAHQLFAVTDFSLGGLGVHLGLGHGLTPASDRWVAKAIFGVSF